MRAHSIARSVILLHCICWDWDRGQIISRPRHIVYFEYDPSSVVRNLGWFTHITKAMWCATIVPRMTLLKSENQFYGEIFWRNKKEVVACRDIYHLKCYLRIVCSCIYKTVYAQLNAFWMIWYLEWYCLYGPTAFHRRQKKIKIILLFNWKITHHFLLYYGHSFRKFVTIRHDQG